MNSIYSYSNYRIFLKDYYEKQRQTNKSFSLRGFALRAGYTTSSASIFTSIIKGRRNLSNSLIQKFANGLNLRGKQREYFEYLVRFNQATKTEDMNRYLEKLTQFKDANYSKIDPMQFRIFGKWYFTTILVMINYAKLPAVHSTFEKIAALLQPAVSISEVEEAISILLNLGMIAINSLGEYINVNPMLHSGEEVRSLEIRNFQMETAKLALEALKSCRQENRDISTMTLGISTEGYHKIKEKIHELRNEISKIAEQDKNEDRVYHCNFQFFPMTKIPISKNQS